MKKFLTGYDASWFTLFIAAVLLFLAGLGQAATVSVGDKTLEQVLDQRREGAGASFVQLETEKPQMILVVLDVARIDNQGRTSEIVRKEVVGHADRLLKSLGVHGGATEIHSGVLNGFSIPIKGLDVERLSRDKHVLFIQTLGAFTPNGIDGSPQSWGLDRIDQRQLPFSNNFTFSNSTIPAVAYVVDTGVRTSHVDFGGRAVTIGNTSLNPDDTDLLNHGTGVASIIAGNKFGIVKSAEIRSIKVMDFGATTAEVVNGLNIAGADYLTLPANTAAVLNFSIGAVSIDPGVDLALQNLIAMGLPVVGAAGNGFIWVNACNGTPGSVSDALIVGGTTRSDSIASRSKTGPCVDVYAPGWDVNMASNVSDSADWSADGTSFSTPHAAGVALLIAMFDTDKSPANIHRRVIEQATPGVLSMGNSYNGSVNRLVYSFPSEAKTKMIECDQTMLPSLYGPVLVHEICQGAPIGLNTFGTEYADSYLLDVAPFDLGSWTTLTPAIRSGWVCGACLVPELLSVLTPAQRNLLQPGQVYKVSFAVGPVWDVTDHFFRIGAPCF